MTYRTSLRLAAAALGLGIAAVLFGALQPNWQERAIADAWQRAVEGESGLIHAIDGAAAGSGNLHPASTAAGPARELVVGERVTVVTPDGSILNLRICDPSSPSATSSSDCLNALVSRAVPPVAAPVPQRSL